MKQHLPTTGERTHASAPTRHHVHPPHQGVSRRRAQVHTACTNVATAAGCAKRTTPLCIDGTWPNTAFARIAMVFAPYHQRPKDPVT